VAPINATNATVTWTSSDETKATVDANGVVTALAAGTTTITATSVSDASKTATSAITVLANAAPVAVITASVVSGSSPLVVAFNSSSSTDSDPGDYVLGFEWDFGDGSGIDKSAAPSHTFITAGTYTVNLRVMDNNNLYGAIVTNEIVVAQGTASVDVAVWDLTNVNAAFNVTTAPVTTKDANLTVSNLTLHPAMGSNSNYSASLLSGMSVDMGNSLAQSISNNYYGEFTITPAAGQSVSITNIAGCFITGGRVGTISLLSSVNGFTANKVISSITTGSSNEVHASLQNLPVTGHDNLISAVTFRIYFNPTVQWDFQYRNIGIGFRHPSQPADVIVSGLVQPTVIAGLLESDRNAVMSFYPNPANNQLNLNFGTQVENTLVSIVDLQGRSVFTKSIANKQLETLDISNLSSGIYFVKVVANGKAMNSKFVKK